MDLDAYVSMHRPSWERLEQLTRARHLSGAQADELLDLYQRVSTHLSVVRSASPDPSVVAYLSALLARARVAQAAPRVSSWRAVLTFWAATFPATLYRLRWWWGVTALLGVAVAVVAGAWSVQHPQVWASQMTPEEIDAYVGTDFENYYSEFAHHEFATRVWVNNAWVAAQAIGMGVLGLPTLYVLAANSVNVGFAGGLMVAHDRGPLFFGLILPHGLLELTAIFVAGGVGLWLCWSWVAPGERTRGQAFAAAGRTAVGVALGLVGVLLVSGVIEGFVTPSSLPTWARIGIGVVVETLFLAYVFVVGRAAAQGGVTGDVAEVDSGDSAPVAA